MKLSEVIINLLLLALVTTGSDVTEILKGLDSREMAEVIDQIKLIVHQQNEIGLGKDDGLSVIRHIIERKGYDPDALLDDHDFLSSLSALFSKGDGRRWTPLNFVYQLACYQGKRGRLYQKALWVWETYNGYGCYCGAGTYYGNFLDATDYCCKVHDHCYERVQKKYQLKIGCHTYTTPYHVSCCVRQRITKCTDGGPSAGRELCECDQAMSKCVAERKARSTYNKHLYKNRASCSDTTGMTKLYSVMDIIKSCKHVNEPKKTFPLTYGSQGTCPKNSMSGTRRRRRRRWWG